MTPHPRSTSPDPAPSRPGTALPATSRPPRTGAHEDGPTALLAGCGDLGTEVALRLIAGGEVVLGLRRRARVLPPRVRGLSVDLTTSTPELPPGSYERVAIVLTADGQDARAYRATYVDGLRRALDADPSVLLMGEDVGRLGGVFRVTEGLQKDFGDKRVIDTPLAESGIIGTAFGMALRGYRPVCEIQFDGFIYPAFNQIVAQVAKIHYRTAGAVRMPLTIRVPYRGGLGAVEHHAESP